MIEFYPSRPILDQTFNPLLTDAARHLNFYSYEWKFRCISRPRA